MPCHWDPPAWDDPPTDTDLERGHLELKTYLAKWRSTATAPPTASSPPPTTAKADGKQAAHEPGATNANASSNATRTAGADNQPPKSTTSPKAQRKS